MQSALGKLRPRRLSTAVYRRPRQPRRPKPILMQLKNVDGAEKKLWGGRFSSDTDPSMKKFNRSLSIDRRLWRHDIKGSQAYARALEKAGLLTKQESEVIVQGLESVGQEWQEERFVEADDEDIHSANERRLTEIVGSVGGKLHTGRSRNDQVVTDTRLWLMNEVEEIRRRLHRLLTVFCDRGETEIDVLMPGFTHLQSAQTVRWSQWLMSHAAALQRDDWRFRDMIPRISQLPLGSGALSGNPFQIDRTSLAKELGFVDICSNSMDAVGDRDFVMEFLFVCSLMGIHLSRLCEDLIVYSSSSYGFLQCSDAYTTGSSLMPQKKNPDGLELIRGKSGILIGNLVAIMTVMKGLPTTYNKDMQECWPSMFDASDIVRDCLDILSGILSTLSINPDNMIKGLSSEMLATDLAEYLVRKGVPFRETHEIAGKAVKMSEDKGCRLDALTVEELRLLHPAFSNDVGQVWSFERSTEMKKTMGGTAKCSIEKQIDDMRRYIAEN